MYINAKLMSNTAQLILILFQ